MSFCADDLIVIEERYCDDDVAGDIQIADEWDRDIVEDGEKSEVKNHCGYCVPGQDCCFGVLRC